MSQYDTDSLYDFLKSTPEKGLRHMLIAEDFSEIHLNLLMKVVRSCSAEEFGRHVEMKDFPRVRTNPKENALKENFWDQAIKCLEARGVLYPAAKKAA